MNETELRMMELAAQGFCCSQILLILGLEAQGRENPELVRAVNGLCQGLGCSGQVCGIMSGGACLLGLYAGKGLQDEERHRLYPLLLEQFTDWFSQLAQGRFGGTRCLDITGENCPAPKAGVCGPLAVEAFDKIIAILVENGLDPSVGRHEQIA